MKNQIIALTTAISLVSGYAIAAEEEIDMSSPTEAYTALGVGYGNEGVNLKVMYMLSEPGADRKSGFILEFNDILDEEGGDPKFSGTVPMTHPVTGETIAVPAFADKTTNRNYRFRYGSLNTKNGLGGTLDAVFKDHPFFGQTAVVQAGPLATIPVGDSAYLWPVLLAGGVIVEDNMQKLYAYDAEAEAKTNLSSSGVDWASTIASFKVYGRYKFSDALWVLGAWTYTEEMSGKSWKDDVADGGLQLSSSQLELSLGYQITNTQNLRLNYHEYSGNGSADKLWLEYNYAF